MKKTIFLQILLLLNLSFADESCISLYMKSMVLVRDSIVADSIYYLQNDGWNWGEKRIYSNGQLDSLIITDEDTIKRFDVLNSLDELSSSGSETLITITDSSGVSSEILAAYSNGVFVYGVSTILRDSSLFLFSIEDEDDAKDTTTTWMTLTPDTLFILEVTGTDSTKTWMTNIGADSCAQWNEDGSLAEAFSVSYAVDGYAYAITDYCSPKRTAFYKVLSTSLALRPRTLTRRLILPSGRFDLLGRRLR
ncbi:MAG TPA: hypothetical protein VLM37_03970 [Fibrobacteraceae bacterium]|nr:hypothetical protein [Fibrobacteraceae bacterium]